MNNKRNKFLSFVVAIVMIATTVLGNVSSVFADDLTVKVGNSFIIDDVVSDNLSYKGKADNAYSQIGSSGLYAVAGTKDVKVKGETKTYGGKIYEKAVTTAGKGVFDSKTKMPKQCAIKFTPSEECKAVVYAVAPNASKTQVTFCYRVEGDTSNRTIGKEVTSTDLLTYEIKDLKANKAVYIFGDNDKFNVYRVDILSNSASAPEPEPEFKGVDLALEIGAKDKTATATLCISKDGTATFNEKSDLGNIIESSKVVGQSINIQFVQGADTSKATLKSTTEGYTYFGTGASHKITVNEKEYTINFSAEPAFEGLTFEAIVDDADSATTPATIEIVIDKDGMVSSATKKNDDNAIVKSINGSVYSITIVMADGITASDVEVKKASVEVGLSKKGEVYNFEVNGVTYTINIKEGATHTPVPDVNLSLTIGFDDVVTPSAIDAVISEEATSSASVKNDEAKIIKSVSATGKVIIINLIDGKDINGASIVAEGYTVAKGEVNGTYTLTKGDKVYTVKLISTEAVTPEPEPTPEVAVPTELTFKTQSADTNLAYNEDGTVKRVALDDYATATGFYALVPSFGETTADGGTENYMTVSKKGVFKTRGNGSVEKRNIRFTPATDGYLTQFIFAGASGSSATTAYIQQVDDASTNTVIAENIAKGSTFKDELAIPLVGGKEYVIYSNVSMDISKIVISKPDSVFLGAEVKLGINYDGVSADSTLTVDKNGKLSVSDVISGSIVTNATVAGSTVTYTISLDNDEDLTKLNVTAPAEYKLEGSGKAWTVTVNEKTYNIKFLFSIAGQAPVEDEMHSGAKYSVEIVDTDKEDNKVVVTVKLENNDLKLTGAQGYLVYDGTLLKPVKAIAVDNALSYNGNAFVNVENLNKTIANSSSGKLKIVGETLTNGGETIADVTESGVLCQVEFEIIKSGTVFVEFAHDFANAKNSKGQIVPVSSIENADSKNAVVTKIGGNTGDDNNGSDGNGDGNGNGGNDGNGDGTTTTYKYMLGDVNLDDEITPADATAIIAEVLRGNADKYITNDADYIKVADVNGDGFVTPADATAIIADVLKKEADKVLKNTIIESSKDLKATYGNK